MIYEGRNTNEISFPIGGIGTGSIGLAGNGRLIDWEIQNKPNKGSSNGFSNFAIKAEDGNNLLDARILNGDYHAPYIGDLNGNKFNNYGFGPKRENLSGFPHFKNISFDGSYPFACIKFVDSTFPAEVELNAFNPFIPLNDKDSSLPASFFEFSVKNNTLKEIDYTIAGSLANMSNASQLNEFNNNDKLNLIHLNSSSENENNNITIATDAEQVSFQEYWYRGSWFDNLSVFWNDFINKKNFKNRNYPYKKDDDKINYSGDDHCSLASHFKLKPGEKKSIRFIISWYYPVVTNYWNPLKNNNSCCNDSDNDCDTSNNWLNYYASLFKSSKEVAVYCLENWNQLFTDTKKFHDALVNSTLPSQVIDAITANLSILKSPTILRLEDGSFYGFEGCHPDSGCCEGSCTHVWNYAYALPFLFPKLERSMRDMDFRHNMSSDGGMQFRLQLPIGSDKNDFRPCVDGQFGGIIKVYREWKISGDDKWLKKLWPAIKKNISFAWSDSNIDKWDLKKTGVINGRQHHTLDMELFGPNSWLTGFYLAALKAAAEMAHYLKDNELADEYLSIYEKGKKWLNSNLFNGDYFYQEIDLKNKSLLNEYINDTPDLTGKNVLNTYWCNEFNEIKYQVSDGCIVDQVIAQWHSNLIGLGEIFDKEKTKSALTSIYKYNFKKNLRDHVNPCRIFALNDESALLICSYPQGKPKIGIPYGEEAMHGFEYQVASHMIQEGMIEQGLEIVQSIRDRYDGFKRNPWNEIECGNNYARSMASYALLIAISGFEYDQTKYHIGFNPTTNELPLKFFWSLDSGWGTVTVDSNSVELSILYGFLDLKSFNFKLSSLDFTNGKIEVDNVSAYPSIKKNSLYFENKITIKNKLILSF